MWKVVAADDEGYIREALQKLINWEKMDCSLESVVSDGQELLEKIRGRNAGHCDHRYTDAWC